MQWVTNCIFLHFAQSKTFVVCYKVKFFKYIDQSGTEYYIPYALIPVSTSGWGCNSLQIYSVSYASLSQHMGHSFAFLWNIMKFLSLMLVMW